MNAADIMTTRLPVAAPDTRLTDLIRVMVNRHVAAVPVMQHGTLLGIVTYPDIIRALASRAGALAELAATDREIRDAFTAALKAPPWSDAASNPTCVVDDGVVNLWGPVDSQEDRRALVELARGLPGVRQVEDNMTVMVHGDPFDRPNWPQPEKP